MKSTGWWSGVTLAVVLMAGAASAQRIGVGAHYWRTVDSMGDGFDRDGLAYVITYQAPLLPLVKLQADLEMFPRGFAGADRRVYAPQALGIVGGVVYGGAGAGILYSDGGFADRLFYLVRAGLDLPVLPNLRLDVHANYHFSEWKGIHDVPDKVSSDTVTLGAALRLSF